MLGSPAEEAALHEDENNADDEPETRELSEDELDEVAGGSNMTGTDLPQ